MYELPTNIQIGDKTFNIRNKGDYRVILDCMKVFNDMELDDEEKLISCLIIFYEDINSYEDLNKLPDIEKAINEMMKFFNVGQEERPGIKTNYKLVDYEQDEQLICSAVNNVANVEIRSVPYCHWYTFMGYYMAIGECTFSTIVNIRYKVASGQKLEKHERKFKNENPQYFMVDPRTIQEKQLTEEFLREVWNKK